MSKVPEYKKSGTQWEEVYEMVFGDNGINRYTHSELIARLGEMYDDSQLVDNHRELLSRLGVITGDKL